MNLSTVHMFLPWILLGVLLAWMCFCAYLAFRPLSTNTQEADGLSTQSEPLALFVSKPRFSATAVEHTPDVLAAGMDATNEVSAAPVA